MPRKKLIQIGVALLLVLAFGIRGLYIRHPVIVGGTMGTRFSVTLEGYVLRSKLERLSRQIEAELGQINAQMSTWDPESEISRFNHSDTTGPFTVSEGFASVVQRSLQLSESTQGAFDPTLQPLLNLWGFGSEGAERIVPSDTELAEARSRTGWARLAVIDGTTLQKSHPALSLDLSAIAKGYGVDVLAGILKEAGRENWFVEIGGEVVVQGLNPAGVPWKIGIQYPTTNPMETGRLMGILNLTSGAVATSGNYYNYVVEEGRIFSHILNPRTGRAMESDTASVTVVAANCMDADAIATALFVMRAEEGMAWVEQHPGVEAMFLVRGADGEISEKFSSGFVAATGYISEK